MQKQFSKDNQELSSIIVSRAGDAISTELDGETVILNIETGVYNGLDLVGTTVWNILESPASFAELAEVILNEYDVRSEQCIEDLCSFLNDLLNNKLIEIRDEKSA